MSKALFCTVMRSLLTIMFLLIIGLLSAQPETAEVDSALFIEAMVNLYDEPWPGDYSRGYRMDRLLRRREFHAPVTLIPLEVRYGAGFYGGGGKNYDKAPGGWMVFEQPVSNLSSEWTQRINQELDLDIGKTNLSHYLLSTSWLDMTTGINLRYSSIFSPAELPVSDWGNTHASWNPGQKSFNPRILGVGISNSVILQWAEWWFINLRYSYGLATAKFYVNTPDNALDDTPSGQGPMVSYDVGVRFILDPGQTIRYSIGLDVRHSYTKITDIDDPGDLTPIRKLRLPNYGIYLTLAAFNGGRKTSGDLGKQFYYRRNYIKAKEKFESFINAHPKHANRKRAQRLLNESIRLIPEQLYREARTYEKEGDPLRALERYRMAEAGADSNLLIVIKAAYERLAEMPLENASNLKNQQQIADALVLVQKAAGYSVAARGQLPKYQAQLAIHNGKAALKYGWYSKALELFEQAQELDPDLTLELNQLRYNVAAALIREANAIDDPAALQLAAQSLEKARELMGGLNESSMAVLEELQARLATYDEGQIQGLIDQRMETAREELQRIQLTIEVGMTVPQIQDLLGMPHDFTERQENGSNYQLWIYQLKNGETLELSFQDYILFKIDRP